ncbi:4'-phosphopantetheinyl transferase family protein [Thalassospira lucentensis]|uniref:4'-phosphopantetheinyl transferase family protein n=1 Tax=Thalassospira lucentensis TaxID=168935 RepID=UPI003D2F1DC1
MPHSTKTCPIHVVSPETAAKAVFGGNVVWTYSLLEWQSHQSRKAQRHSSSLYGWMLLEKLSVDIFGPSVTIETLRESSGRPFIRVNGTIFSASLSHSKGLVCAAISKVPSISIGIDVEQLNKDRDLSGISQSMGWPDDCDVIAFYQRWCCYEATFKATGIDNVDHQPLLQSEDLMLPNDFIGVIVCADK